MPPLVLLIIDSGDIELVKQWADEGYLPAIARVIGSGIFRPVTGASLINEMGSWTSLFSGRSKARHGFYSVRQLIPGTYRLAPTRPSTAIDAPPFWHRMAHAQKRVAVIDPPEGDVWPDAGGLQLANYAAHESERLREPLASIPPGLKDEMVARHGSAAKLATFMRDRSGARDRYDCRTALGRIRQKGAIIRDILSRGAFDFILTGFVETHTLGHRLLGRLPPHAAGDDAYLGLRDLYQATDAEFGEVIARAPGANIFVVSAYGLTVQYPIEGLVASFMRELGYQPPAVGASRSDVVDYARAIVPAPVRRWISRRLPVASQEQLIASDLERSTDWARTTAFAIPSLYTAAIRVNLVGREPHGTVNPGGDYLRLLAKLSDDFNSLTDPVTERPAVSRILRTVEAFDSDSDHSLPDLFVEFEPVPHFISELAHPRARITQARHHYDRPSYHRTTGFVAAMGPDVARLTVPDEIDLLDLAPTFLSLLGLPAPPTMTGRSLLAAAPVGARVSA